MSNQLWFTVSTKKRYLVDDIESIERKRKKFIKYLFVPTIGIGSFIAHRYFNQKLNQKQSELAALNEIERKLIKKIVDNHSNSIDKK